MLGLLSSQLAFSAATTLAKKTFEFSITSSLKGLSDVIRERFSHSQVLQETQAELEAKVKMLCLPVDLLAHFATRGNTALQEPLGVALGALEEVEAFRQALVQHDVARAQDGSSPDAATASAAQLCKRLRELIARLDSLLPYLNLAISTAVLLSQAAAAAGGAFGYDLLIEQDLDDGLYHEPGEQAAALRVQVADIVGLEWETTQSLGQGENEYRPALVLHIWQSSGATVAGAEAPTPAAAAGAQAADGELRTPPGSSSRPASRASSRRGGQGAEDSAGAAGGGAGTPQHAPWGGGTAGVGGALRRCAVILNPQPATDGGDSDSDDDAGGGAAHDAVGEDSDDSAGGGVPGLPSGHGGLQPGGAAALQREWRLLGELEFVLRLCILECREQAPHQAVTDERIALHFQDTSTPASLHAHRGAPTTDFGHAAAYDSALQRRGGGAAAAAVQRWRSAAAGAAHALSDGMEALTQGVRQLSFTPGGGRHSGGVAAPSAPTPDDEAAAPASSAAGSVGSRRQTRSSSRAGGHGFGSPVQ